MNVPIVDVGDMKRRVFVDKLDTARRKWLSRALAGCYSGNDAFDDDDKNVPGGDPIWF